jgi:hypothetical protein
MNDCVSLPANPHAGPNEQRLRKLVTSSVADIDKAITEWRTGAEALSEVASNLSKQAEQLIEGYGKTGEIVARSYTTLAKNVRVREDEMKNVVLGLQDARKVVVESGPREFNSLPDVAGPPDTDVMSMSIAARWERFDQQKSAREAKAAEALRTLDGEFQTAATRMGAPTPDDTNYTSSSETNSTGPLSTASSGSVKSVRTGLITRQDPTDQQTTQPVKHDPVDDSGLIITTPTDPGTGHTSGDEHPTTSTGTIGSPGSSTGSTAAGGGAGAAAALGAGAVSGAGSVMASRGGAPVRAVATGSTGAIGKSATTTSRGALGRGAMGALPGQTGAPGSRGSGAGRAGARGVVPGATQTQGRSGGRAGKGPLSAAATGGRNGKRGEEREEGTEHFEYDDSQSWLDDEATSEPVID